MKATVVLARKMKAGENMQRRLSVLHTAPLPELTDPEVILAVLKENSGVPDPLRQELNFQRRVMGRSRDNNDVMTFDFIEL